MNPRHFFALLIVHGLFLATPSHAGEDSPHWTYEGEHGAEHWGDLSPDFIQCKVGVNQSPINIVDSVETDLPPLILDYTSKTVDLVNNGHTAQLSVEPGSYLRVEGEEFELLQFHLHVPSEHHVNGEQFLLEAHFVHQNSRGELAVIGVLYSEGEDPEKLAKFISVIPTEVSKPTPLVFPLKELELYGIDKDYYRYNGSLTTPPCSEGVRWYVLKDIQHISKKRRDRFNLLIGDDARGPQPINARPVLR
jgi:carbonic anhydrase